MIIFDFFKNIFTSLPDKKINIGRGQRTSIGKGLGTGKGFGKGGLRTGPQNGTGPLGQIGNCIKDSFKE